jgi:glyoxylase-like metal-dependent hydrolase (beta-lactamase superfamily II)
MAAVRLHPLLCGTARWPEAWPHRADGRGAGLKAIGIGSDTIELPLVAFLVEHPEQGPMLIDTGLDPVITEGAHKSMGRVLGTVAARSFRTKPEWAVTEQARARGVDPDDIETVLMTHLHFDHASGMPLLPKPTFLVSREEWHAAHTRGAIFQAYVGGHFPEESRVRKIEFGGPHGSFSRSADLFGDGSVIALFTPGHTPGHVSYLLQTGSGEVLVAGDAVYTRHTLETGHLPAIMANGEKFKRSLAEIREYAKEHPGTLVIPGHDFDDWRTLEQRY